MTICLALNEALERLAAEDPQAAELVKLRFFAGLTMEVGRSRDARHLPSSTHLRRLGLRARLAAVAMIAGNRHAAMGQYR